MTFRLRPESWEGAGPSENLEEEGRAFKGDSKCKGPGVRNSWVCPCWSRKMVARIQWVQNETERWGQAETSRAKSHMTVHSVERSSSHVNVCSSCMWESWPSDLLSNLPKVTQVQSGEICLSDPKAHSRGHQTVLLLRLWDQTLSYGPECQGAVCVCVRACVCVIRDFLAFLKPHQ